MAGSMLRIASTVVIAGLALAGCTGSMPSLSLPSWAGGDSAPPPPPQASGPMPRPSLAAEDIVGRWGIASFHKPEDQARTEAAARGQCSQPYVINRSSTGVAMLGHDSPEVQDMMIKASADGRTYIGPGPDAGSADDREYHRGARGYARRVPAPDSDDDVLVCATTATPRGRPAGMAGFQRSQPIAAW